MAKSQSQKIYELTYQKVYPMYLAKVERKGQDASGVDDLVSWLTGYSKDELAKIRETGLTFEQMIHQMPQPNPKSSLITGSICGVKVETIEDEVVRYVRYMDKLVDELAKGKPLEKIKRN